MHNVVAFVNCESVYVLIDVCFECIGITGLVMQYVEYIKLRSDSDALSSFVNTVKSR